MTEIWLEMEKTMAPPQIQSHCVTMCQPVWVSVCVRVFVQEEIILAWSWRVWLSLSPSDAWWLSGTGGCPLESDTGESLFFSDHCLMLVRHILFLLWLLLYNLPTSIPLMSPGKHVHPYSAVRSTSLSIVLETRPVMFMLQHPQISPYGELSSLFHVTVSLHIPCHDTGLSRRYIYADL